MTATRPAPHPPQRTLLALDGGNSKTDIAVIREDGTVLSRRRSGPFIPHMIGAPDAVALLAADIEDALGILDDGVVDLAVGYLANADLPIEEHRIGEAIRSHGWARSVIVENDTLAMLRTGTSAGFGVAVVCGAGINGVGVGADGTRVRFPALGRISGDWGGGLGISKEVLWHCSRAESGRGPATTLTRGVADHFGLPNAVAVTEAMHLGTLDFDRMHEIVPVLFREARRGDAIARAVVQRQAEEIALLATTALTRLGMQDGAPEVVLGGGMLTSGEALLVEPVIAAIRAVARHARITIVDDAPIVGSALLGLDMLWESDAHLSEHERALRTATLRATLRTTQRDSVSA